jgi:hypothetical protein
MDADVELKNGKSAKKQVEAIGRGLPVKVRGNFHRRAIYDSIYVKPVDKPIVEFHQLPKDYHRGFLSEQSESRFQDVRLPDALKSLKTSTRRRAQKMYGIDLLKTDISVRYANQDIALPTAMESDDPHDVNERLLSPMHLDQKKGITTIVYLTDVSETSGCFSYLDGSHLIPQSPILRALQEVICFDLGLRHRVDVLKGGLPACFCGSSFTVWEPMPAEKRQIARQYLTKHTGPAGTSITFVGNMLVHSGGFPIQGERVALFIAHIGLVLQRMKPIVSYCLDRVA